MPCTDTQSCMANPRRGYPTHAWMILQKRARRSPELPPRESCEPVLYKDAFPRHHYQRRCGVTPFAPYPPLLPRQPPLPVVLTPPRCPSPTRSLVPVARHQLSHPPQKRRPNPGALPVRQPRARLSPSVNRKRRCHRQSTESNALPNRQQRAALSPSVSREWRSPRSLSKSGALPVHQPRVTLSPTVIREQRSPCPSTESGAPPDNQPRAALSLSVNRERLSPRPSNESDARFVEENWFHARQVYRCQPFFDQ